MKPPSEFGIPLRLKGRAACPQAAAGAVGTPRPTDFRGHRSWRWLCLTVTLAATGCLGLKPARVSTQHLVLSAPATGDVIEARVGSPGFGVGLAPVILPEYLDRPWVAVRHGDNEIRYSATHRWGERLDQGVRRVLAAHLRRGLAPAHVEERTWTPNAVAYELTVEFQHCEVSTDGQVQIEGVWRLSRPLSAEVVQRGTHRVETVGPRPEEDPTGAAAALSAALAEFARRMADALAPVANPRRAAERRRAGDWWTRRGGMDAGKNPACVKEPKEGSLAS